METPTIRSIEPDELPRFMDAIELAFHDVPSEEDVAHERRIAEPDRYFIALEGDEIVGTAGACSTTFTVPGGRSVAVPGVTAVGVRPSHRRRGINTALMGTLLDQAVERGEPFAYLWASESPIYGRFGYGMASLCAELEVGTDRAAFVRGADTGGSIRVMPRVQALRVMRPIYARVAAGRPGMIDVNDEWWAWLFEERKRDEGKPSFFAVHEDENGERDGYAVYKVKHEWIHGVPTNELELQHLIAASPQATASLWRYLLDIDLVATVKAWDRPADDELLWLAAEPRRLKFALSDGLWVRVLDVEASLAARAYPADGRLVLEVHDTFRPATSGRYELVVRDGEGACTRTEAAPELVGDIGALGAAYLGGSSWSQLARAGAVREEVPGVLGRADAMFASDPSPWFGFIF